MYTGRGGGGTSCIPWKDFENLVIKHENRRHPSVLTTPSTSQKTVHLSFQSNLIESDKPTRSSSWWTLCWTSGWWRSWRMAMTNELDVVSMPATKRSIKELRIVNLPKGPDNEEIPSWPVFCSLSKTSRKSRLFFGSRLFSWSSM